MKTTQLDKRRLPHFLLKRFTAWRQERRRGETGFTLIELIVTIVVTAVLAGFTAHLLTSGVDTYEYLNVRKEGLESSRMALQRIVKEMRQAADPAVIQKATPDSLRYLNIDNQSMQVRYANQSILLNGQVLIDQVSQFQLTFFDGNGAQLAFPITNTANIWRIRLAFVYSAEGEPIALQQDIVPRNFRN
jgi:prepilin-type N-terminal cleavage/methylation domain-containing protein